MLICSLYRFVFLLRVAPRALAGDPNDGCLFTLQRPCHQWASLSFERGRAGPADGRFPMQPVHLLFQHPPPTTDMLPPLLSAPCRGDAAGLEAFEAAFRGRSFPTGTNIVFLWRQPALLDILTCPAGTDLSQARWVGGARVVVGGGGCDGAPAWRRREAGVCAAVSLPLSRGCQPGNARLLLSFPLMRCRLGAAAAPASLCSSSGSCNDCRLE